MRRRAFVRTIGGTSFLAVSAGCLFRAPGGNSLELTKVESLVEFAATQPSEFTPEQQALVDTALSEGEYVTRGYQPFQDDAYLEVDGEFYRTTVTETGTKRMTRQVLGADVIDEAPNTVSIEDYPAHDQDLVVRACRLAIARERNADRDGAFDDSDRFIYVFRTISEDETSLLPAPQYDRVKYVDRTFQLWVEERTLEETEYTTTLSHVASSAEEFERRVEDEYVIDLDAHTLTEDQQTIIETAIEDGYSEQGQISDSFNELINFLHDQEPRSDSLIKYDGEYYTWRYWHSD